MRYFLTGFVLVLSTGVAIADAPAPVAPPEPEQYLVDGHYSDYAKAAQSYLRTQSDSPAAPRVAMDLLLTATVYDDQNSAMRMRMLMLAAYPTSVQAKYMIGSLPDAAQFAQLMALVAAANFESMPPGFPSKFNQAQRLGVARFGAAALGSGPELVEGLLLAQMAGDAQIAQAEVQLLNQGGPASEIWRQILTITADTSTPPLKRLQNLHGLANRTAAVPFEEYMITQLPDAQRQSPEVMRIEADDLLQAGRLAEALPLLDKLAAADAKNDARILFWKAWAQAAGGDASTADAGLKQIIASMPADPWAKEAAELEPAVGGLDANLVRNVEAALSASRRMKLGVGSLEGRGTFVRDDGQPIGMYLGIDSPNVMELVMQRGGQTALMYRASEQEASIYLPGDVQIARYTKPIVFPAPKLGVTRAGPNFRFAGDVRFVASFDELQTALTDLLASDILATREGLEDVLHDFAHRGILPMPPQAAADGAMVYTWMSPAVAEPTAGRVSLTVAADGTIRGLDAGSFQITDLRYGPAGSLKLTAPPPPAVPTMDRGAMNLAVLQTALPALHQLLYPPPPAPPSTQPSQPSGKR